MKEELLFENENFSFHISGDVYICTLKVKTIDYNFAKAMVDKRKEITNNQVIKAIINGTAIKYMHKEARLYLASSNAVHNVKASGIIVNSSIQKLLTSFFLNFDKPQVPIKVFTDISSAKNWLSTID
jgi:hypothetical protein